MPGINATALKQFIFDEEKYTILRKQKVTLASGKEVEKERELILTAQEAQKEVSRLIGTTDSNASKALYKGVNDPETDRARRAFIEHLEANYGKYKALTEGTPEEREKHPEKYAKKFTEIFDKTTLNLYQAAVKEERNTKAFRNAVFLHSCKKFGKKKWKDRIALWLPGASATGKTYSAEGVLKMLDSSLASDEGGENTVVFVDGDSDRKVSQMRQLLLKTALKKGYSGVSDLNEQASTAIKANVMNAAVATPYLNLAVPSTFNRSIKSPLSSALRGEFKKLAKKNFKQILAPVQAVPGKRSEGRFKKNSLIMGNTRAYLRKKYGDESGEDINVTNLRVKCESKAHGGESSFQSGVNNAKRVRKEFAADVPDGMIIDIANDAILLKRHKFADRDGIHTVITECRDGDAEEWIVSEREYRAFALRGANYEGSDFDEWLEEYRASNPEAYPRVLKITGCVYSPFEGYERLSTVAEGGGQAKSAFSDFYRGEDGNVYYIKHTAEEAFTGDDIAEVLSSTIARKGLGNSSSIFADCKPVRAADGSVYVASRCSSGWEPIYKHGSDRYGIKGSERFGKNFITSLQNPRTRKTEPSDPRHRVYKALSSEEGIGGSSEKQQLAKALASSLWIMDHDCHTENLGRTDEGIVKIDHGWGLVNILKDKHKRVDPYVFKGLRGKRGGNVRNTPTNHFVDFPDVLAGEEFIEAIEALHQEFTKFGKQDMKASIQDSIRQYLDCFAEDVMTEKGKKVQAIKFLMKHIRFDPSLIQPGVKNIDDLSTAGQDFYRGWVETIAGAIADRMELRLESMNLYKYVLLYKNKDDNVFSKIEPKTKRIKVQEFDEIMRDFEGIKISLERMSELDRSVGGDFRLENYICDECGSGLMEMISRMTELLQDRSFDIDVERIERLEDMKSYLQEVSRAAANGSVYNQSMCGAIDNLYEEVINKEVELQADGYDWERRLEEADKAPVAPKRMDEHIGRANKVVKGITSYSGHGHGHDDPISHKAPKTMLGSRGPQARSKATATLRETFNVEAIKETMSAINPAYEFSSTDVDERFINDTVSIDGVDKVILQSDTEGEKPTKLESVTTSPDESEIITFAQCIIASGCKEPKFKTGNIDDLIQVLEHLKKEGYQCSPVVSARLFEKAGASQVGKIESLLDELPATRPAVGHRARQ